MVEFFEKLKAVALSLWPFVNAKAREQAKAKGDEAAAQVRTLDDARKASEDRE